MEGGLGRLGEGGSSRFVANADPGLQESREKLSVCSKLCYAVGGAPYQITGCALGFFLQIYLLDVAQVRPPWGWAGLGGGIGAGAGGPRAALPGGWSLAVP